jgi:hypothetical protein
MRKSIFANSQKDTHVKYILLTAIAALFCSTCFAEDWKSYFKNEQIEIQYRYADCHDEANGIHQQKVLLKFVNFTNGKTAVSFSKELNYNSSKPASTDVKTFTLLLNAGESKEGLCSEKDNALFIFSKQLNFKSDELAKFELKNISVKTIQ